MSGEGWVYLCRTDREFEALVAEAERQCLEAGHPHLRGRGRLSDCAAGLVLAEKVCAERWSREWVDGVGWPAKRVPIALGPPPPTDERDET